MDWENLWAQVEAYNDRHDRIVAAGGIPYEWVLDNVVKAPVGWAFDDWSRCYLPPGYDPDKPPVVH